MKLPSLLLWNRKIHHSVHNKITKGSYLQKDESSLTYTPYFYEIPFNIIVIYAQVFRVVSSLKVVVCWDVAPCSQADIDRRFRGAYCLHHPSYYTDGGGGKIL
jgi:hypothetical protein